jgi:hypothetical protein
MTRDLPSVPLARIGPIWPAAADARHDGDGRPRPSPRPRLGRLPWSAGKKRHSHSIVPGGLDVTS